MKRNSFSDFYWNFYHKKIRPVTDSIRATTVSVDDLFLSQKYNGEFFHNDIVIKYMVLEHHFLNMHPDIWKTYYTMQYDGNQLYADTRIASFKKVLKSLEEKGYMPENKISVDSNLFVRDGCHRTAMALFFGAETVDVLPHSIPCNTQKYLSEYKAKPFTPEERISVEKKLSELTDKSNKPLNIVLFGSSADKADAAAELLGQYGTVISCRQYNLGKNQCRDICRDIARADNLYNKKHTKISATNNKIAVIQLKLTEPHMTAVENNKPAVLKKYINYRIPLIKQTAEIRKALTEKISVKENQLFIPQNFLINSRFGHILDDL